MKALLETSDLIVFDMDGTLYEGSRHYDFYANEMMKTVPEIHHEEYKATYKQIMDGTHHITVGMVYDVHYDCLLTIHPLTLHVQSGLTWEGLPLSKETLEDRYEQMKITLTEEKRFVPIGDGWWIPIVLVVHFGVYPQWEVYTKTKTHMLENEGYLVQTSGLREGLQKLREDGKIIIVATNSEEEDARSVLEALQLAEYFHEMIHTAKKPIQTVQHFQYLSEKYNVPFEKMLSIGDNLLNEIAPALTLGMNAVYITHRDFEFERKELVLVNTLADAF